MNARILPLVCSIGLLIAGGLAYSAESATVAAGETYQMPRTEYDQPDLQGVWTTVFYTMLERPPGMPLVLPPEPAAGFAEAIYTQGLSGNTDPDVDRFGTPTLAKVKGEFRSSVIVYPENGRLPYN
ncbi:MAG: hypothetical protein WD772_02055, partial [Pseudohongiellaceae bacterium]